MTARHNVILAAVLGALLAPGVAAAALPAAPPSPPAPLQASASTPVDFIATFYRAYFADPAAARTRYVDSGSFYSRALVALMEANRAACAKTARESSKCGWNADGDEFLHAQERDPALTLASSGFVAIAAGAKLVDVRLRLFPDDPETTRAIRYVLVREAGQWRVDDVIGGSTGAFPRRNSLRSMIAAESDYAIASARDLGEQVNWVNIFIENEAVDTFAGFAAFPLTVCDTQGACVPYQQKDARLPALVKTLNLVYFDKGSVRPGEPARTRRMHKAIHDGRTVRIAPFDYTFRDGQWWLTRIDLRLPPARR